MIKSLLLILPIAGLLAMGGCTQSRSLETAQKTPALKPQAREFALDLPTSGGSVSRIPLTESGMRLAIEQY